MSDLDDEDLEAISARTSAALDGPWWTSWEGRDHSWWTQVADRCLTVRCRPVKHSLVVQRANVGDLPRLGDLAAIKMADDRLVHAKGPAVS